MILSDELNYKQQNNLNALLWCCFYLVNTIAYKFSTDRKAVQFQYDSFLLIIYQQTILVEVLFHFFHLQFVYPRSLYKKNMYPKL